MAKRQRLTSGDLKHQVTVFAPPTVLHETEAVDVATDVPAKIEVLPPAFQANEAQALGGPRTATKYNVTTRYRTDIRASFVIRELCCTQREFQIVAVVPGNDRDQLEMTCLTNG